MIRLQKLIDTILKYLNTPIAIALAVALWGIPLRLVLDLDISKEDYENIKQFIEWFGVPYGLLLALVLVNVWTQFETTERAFDSEADSVEAIYNTFLLVKDIKLRNNLHLEILNYVNHVRNHCFDECNINDPTSKEKGDKIINNIREIIGKVIHKKGYKEIGIELLRFLNTLSDDRGDRLSHSSQRMPPTVRGLSIIASFLWLAPFFALEFANPLLQASFLTGVTLVVVSILLIIDDLDNPVGGDWEVKMNSWDALVKKYEGLDSWI